VDDAMEDETAVPPARHDDLALDGRADERGQQHLVALGERGLHAATSHR
jgi:hypothetical protein